jgi:hypothetical protein
MECAETMLSIEGFDSLLLDADTALLRRAPTTIIYTNSTDLNANASINEAVITQEVGEGANLYALWSRDSDSDLWRVMYIGQRTRQFVVERIKQHLFQTPRGTQSKIEAVRQRVQSGKTIGLSTILVTPDPVRLSVEDQLIFRNTNAETDLPWNNKSRNVPLPRP